MMRMRKGKAGGNKVRILSFQGCLALESFRLECVTAKDLGPGPGGGEFSRAFKNLRDEWPLAENLRDEWPLAAKV